MLSTKGKRQLRNGTTLGLIISMIYFGASMVSAQSIREAETPPKAQTKISKSDIVVINFPVQGWYLVSVPLAATDSSVSAIFPSALGVFTWDSANNRYIRPTTIQIGRGYWVLVASPTSVVISGTRFSQFNGHYKVGWHLIGSLMDSVNFANPNDTPDRSIIVPIFAWNVGTQRYYSTTTIEQSFGQWMAVLQECDVTVKSGSSLAIEKSADHVVNQKFVQRFGAMPPAPPFRIEQALTPTSPPASMLLSNYPNPFFVNAGLGQFHTVIRYSLTQSGPTSVLIYNTLGQKVRTLMEQEQSAGFHEVIWDGRNDEGQSVVSGIYYYQLTFNGLVQTQKLLLAR